MSDRQARLNFDADDPLDLRDAEARVRAVDPTRNVALEASAGTGKTRVLVDRYVALLLAGAKPRNILAMTFTRKAAVEMRQRILHELARRQKEQTLAPELWREIRENLPDVAISTIDAFCLALLREFPLEADVDPGFELIDETETPRLVGQTLDRTLGFGRSLAADESDMALLFAELGELRLREGLARLLDRRLVAWPALGRFLRGKPHLTIDECIARLQSRLRAAFDAIPGGIAGLMGSAPAHADIDLLAGDLDELLADPPPSGPLTQALLERLRAHVLTQSGEPRKRLAYKKADFRSPADFERHAAAVTTFGPYLVDALRAYREDINVVLARAVQRLLAVALDQYQRTLRKHGVLDFSDVLQRTLTLLAQMDEFSRSRFKLESRYQHVLVDEFQDTSRAQWELVERLIASWAAGRGLSAHTLEPSIFIVGDRKQSIYSFRDAEVALLDEASRYIDALRSTGPVRMAITRNFRSVREILAFTNDLFEVIDKAQRPDAFRYSEDDVFPLGSVEARESDALGLVPATSDEAQAEAIGEEIARLLATGATVRDRESGIRRAARPGDIAVLFRTREGHRLFEEALARRRVPFYVYKGLGFYDADEIKDVLALLTFLARPESELAAAALLRSRVVRLSDEALKLLAPALTASILGADTPPALEQLHVRDRERLLLLRGSMPAWLDLVDRLPPSELLDRVLAESAYAEEIGGASYRQARENLKKIRSLVRRLQNRGYLTLGRIVDHFAELVSGGDESNAIVDAVDAVNLMTTHAAKGLEFPIVFVANMQRGSGGGLEPIRVVDAALNSDSEEPSVAIGDYETPIDRDLEARDAEEGKRLLYVALTRARDRLYLAATLGEEKQLAAGRGGLGRTLPPPVAALFTEAVATLDAQVVWRGPSSQHRFRVIRDEAAESVAPPAAETREPRRDDFSALSATGPRRLVADAGKSLETDWLEPAPASESSSSRRLRIPFSSRDDDGTIVRGVVDCIVHDESNSIDVIVSAHDASTPAHDRHVTAATRVAQTLFAGSSVHIRVVS